MSQDGSKKIHFTSIYANLYVRMPEKVVREGGREVTKAQPPCAFRLGQFSTDDPAQIKRLRNCSEFGKTLFEFDPEKADKAAKEMEKASRLAGIPEEDIQEGLRLLAEKRKGTGVPKP